MKRLPIGIPLKYKYCYCVHGDLQTAGVDYLETYAPAVQMSTAQLALTTSIPTNFYTKQVDYTNTFYQAYLKGKVCIDPPRGFGGFTNTNVHVSHMIHTNHMLKQIDLFLVALKAQKIMF